MGTDVEFTTDHVLRASPPWRKDDQLTECGKPANTVDTVITRGGLITRVAAIGQRRTAFSVCGTCLTTAEWQNRSQWDTAPEQVVVRAIKRRMDLEQVRHELWALAALVEAHREEFDELVTGLGQAPQLSAYRNAKRRNGHV